MKNRKWFLVMLVVVSFLVAEGARGQQQLLLLRAKAEPMTDQQLVSATDEEIAQAVQQALRSAFLENQGQVAIDEVAFYGFLANGKIGFGESKVLLWLEGWNSVVTLHFAGAQAVNPIGTEVLVGKSNYFLGERGTYTNVRSFGIIVYNDLWEGIDLYYQATPMGVKYEFRVAAGAKPEDISISCEGQEQLSIGKDSLTILKGAGRFVDEGLKVLQEGVEIDARFVAKGSNTFGFQLSKYDQKKPLVIDPLLYSTFVGGSDSDYGGSLALDSAGNAYVTGYTKSSNFPTTANAYNRTHGGNFDCFVCKLAANGSSLLYSTFVGGSSDDFGSEIVLDDERNAYVTGETRSSNFPTTVNAYNRTCSGDRDCFVCKLAADGSSLLYSTFVGGSGRDHGGSLALDSAGNAYVTGGTESNDFPTTANAYNRTYGGGEYGDCFVFKLAADGSSLLYSTFVGGSSSDGGYSIALDSTGNAYVTGYTFSSDFPTTANAYQRTHGDGTDYGYRDCFVFKLSADGSSLLYSTFVGGSDGAIGYSLALDSERNAYVTGGTESSDFPTTANAYQRTYGGGYFDCFVFKLSADGSSLLYSTYVGGSDGDGGYSLALDSERNAYVTGGTESSDFPTTANAYNRTYGGYFDCFVFKLSADGSSLLYSTFVGGSDGAIGYSLAPDSTRNVYVTGYTKSSNFPTTPNAYKRTYSGQDDCFVFKLPVEDAPPTITTPPPTTTTPPETSTPPTTTTFPTTPTTTTSEKTTFIIAFLLITSLTTIASVAIISHRRRKRKITN